MMLIRTCPMCKERNFLVLDKSATAGYDEYRLGEKLIQECLPEMVPSEREFLKTGYCGECQSMLFGIKSSKNIKSIALVD